MGKSPDLPYIRVFSCKFRFVIPKINQTKLDYRSKPGKMLRYLTQSKGYKIWYTDSQSLIISREFKFEDSSLYSPIATFEDSDAISDSLSVHGGEVRKELKLTLILQFQQNSQTMMLQVKKNYDISTMNHRPSNLLA